MKKPLLITLLSSFTLISLGQNGQIQNGDLESWFTDTVGMTIDIWETSESQWPGMGTIERSSDSQDQNYSLHLETVLAGNDTAFGYAIYGGIGQNGPDQHYAYTDQVDSIIFWMKHSMGVNDSVTILVSRVPTGMTTPVVEIFKVGGSQSSWTRYAFPLIPMTQDSILLGFASSDAFVPYAVPGSYATIDNVQLTSATGTPSSVPNNSFENWNFSTIEQPENLYTLNAWLAGQPTLPVNKTTDAYLGMYAATVQTLLIGQDTIPGFLLNAPLIPGQQPQAIPYVAQPTSFEGAYKYTPANGDGAIITCVFYSGGTVIDQPFVSINSTVSNYTTFSVPLNLATAPDSMSLVIFSGDNPGSILWVDELSLSGGNVGYQDLLGLDGLKLYPNPAKTTTRLEFESTNSGDATSSLYTIDGKLVLNQSLALVKGENIIELDLMGLPSGNYLIDIQSDFNRFTKKLIIE